MTKSKNMRVYNTLIPNKFEKPDPLVSTSGGVRFLISERRKIEDFCRENEISKIGLFLLAGDILATRGAPLSFTPLGRMDTIEDNCTETTRLWPNIHQALKKMATSKGTSVSKMMRPDILNLATPSGLLIIRERLVRQ